MANYNTTANVVLSVNGKQAQQVLSSLQREASNLEKKIAQTAIDKAKKRVTELAIELGEKLYPIMKHIYTSSGIFLRVLNVLVDFIVEHRKACRDGLHCSCIGVSRWRT